MTDGFRQEGQNPVRTVLADSVYEALKERIMDRGLPPGARLNIDGLAAEHGVSPTPVREALARLSAEGLVHSEAFKGYAVMPLLTPRRFAHLMQVRRLIEADAARHAATRIILAQLRAMERALEDLAASRPEARFTSFRVYLRHDQTFHELLIGAADNDVLLETFRSLNVHAQLARLYHDRGEVSGASTAAEHAAILQALEARDPDAAARAVVAHLDASERRAGAALEAQLAGSVVAPVLNNRRLTALAPEGTMVDGTGATPT
jgi:DNA-binding GntR family transcriptional regulator